MWGKAGTCRARGGGWATQGWDTEGRVRTQAVHPLWSLDTRLLWTLGMTRLAGPPCGPVQVNDQWWLKPWAVVTGLCPRQGRGEGTPDECVAQNRMDFRGPDQGCWAGRDGLHTGWVDWSGVAAASADSPALCRGHTSGLSTWHCQLHIPQSKLQEKHCSAPPFHEDRGLSVLFPAPGPAPEMVQATHHLALPGKNSLKKHLKLTQHCKSTILQFKKKTVTDSLVQMKNPHPKP